LLIDALEQSTMDINITLRKAEIGDIEQIKAILFSSLKEYEIALLDNYSVSDIAKDVVTIAKCEEKSVSVAFEEIEKEDWAKKVYKPDILDRSDSLYKEPGYNPFE
jgi:4-oxalocrotonate tautomerase